jgi:excisionase family DNA binding protein
MNEKLLYSRKEAATLLSIGLRKLDYLIEQGVFKPCRIGRKVTISAKQLIRFAAGDWPQLGPGYSLPSAGRGQHRIQ